MRTFWRRPGLLVNAGLCVLALAGALWAYQTVMVSNSTSTTSTSSGGLRIVPVSTGTVTATVTASGSVQSANTANADFGTSGTVTEIDVHVGDAVTKGQVLAKLDPTATQDALNTAKANLNAAQQALDRANAATTVDAATVASAQAQVASAQATVDSDQQALNGTVLTAPIAGTVTVVNGAVGGSASGSATSGSGGSGGTGGNGGSGGAGANSGSSSGSSGSGFIQLADLSQMQVSAYFAESDATKLKVGQAANITWSALASTRATGKVASIAPTATTQNSVNSYLVVISLDSVPTGVRIGQTTSVSVTTGRQDNVLRVLAAAVRSAGGRYTVQLVTGPNNQTTTTVVQVGLVGDTYDEITGGLQEGQQVAIQRQASTGASGGPGGFLGGIGGIGGGGGGGGGGGNRGGGAGGGGTRGGG